MKNLKLLPLLGIVMCSLLSFTYLNPDNLIKNGTYNAVIQMKYLTKPGNNGQTYIQSEDGLTIRVENELIKEVISYSKMINNNKLIGLTLKTDEKGNAFVETSDLIQNSSNPKSTSTTLVDYKLIIKKEELNN